jgi:hypothetical protein
MKHALMMTLASFSFALSAHATSLSGAEHTCIAVRDGVSHVAAMVADPADCCTGRMQCSQYLSTTTLVRPRHNQHT